MTAICILPGSEGFDPHPHKPRVSWDPWTTSSLSSEKCGEYVLPLMDPRSGRFFCVPSQCDSLREEACASRRLADALTFFESKFALETQIYYTEDAASRRDLMQRARRAKPPADVVRFRHWDGRQFVFSTAQLTSEGVWLPTTAAFELLYTRVLVVGRIAERPSGGGNWHFKWERSARKRALWCAGRPMSSASAWRLFDFAADMAELKFGVRPLAGDDLPAGIPRGEWEALLEEAFRTKELFEDEAD